jgi:hypothetical protein
MFNFQRGNLHFNVGQIFKQLNCVLLIRFLLIELYILVICKYIYILIGLYTIYTYIHTYIHINSRSIHIIPPNCTHTHTSTCIYILNLKIYISSVRHKRLAETHLMTSAELQNQAGGEFSAMVFPRWCAMGMGMDGNDPNNYHLVI